MITTFAPATNEESDFIIKISSKHIVVYPCKGKYGEANSHGVRTFLCGVIWWFPWKFIQNISTDFVEAVHLVGQRGGQITLNMILPVQEIKTFCTHIIIIEAGANDAAKISIKIHHISEQILDHAGTLTDLHEINLTVICSLIKCDIGMDMSPQKFGDKIFYVNKNLKEATKVEPAIKYHSHPGFWRDRNGGIATSTQFSYDGQHPNSPNGCKLYAKSIKASIHYGVRDINLGRECRQHPAFY